MKNTKFRESRIIGILKGQEQGRTMADICRTHGISQPTFYGWKSWFSGIEVSQVKWIKELDAALGQYKKIVTKQMPHILVCHQRNGFSNGPIFGVNI